jgi:hypothetical protein
LKLVLALIRLETQQPPVLDFYRPPASRQQSIRRQLRREFVVLLGESRDGQKQQFLLIIRSGNGKFFGFSEIEVPGMDEMKGQFAQILSPKVPDDEMRLLAKTMLKVKGVKVAQGEHQFRRSGASRHSRTNCASSPTV